MITYVDRNLLDLCIDALSAELGQKIVISEKNSGKLFPYIRGGNLFVNRHLETYLLLQNLSSIYHRKLKGISALFYDAYTLIDYNYYDLGESKILLFEQSLDIIFDSLKENDVVQKNIDINVQILSAVNHELGHIIFKNNEGVKSGYIASAIKEIQDQIDTLKRQKFAYYTNFFARGRYKNALQLIQNERALEEIACDFFSAFMTRGVLIASNYSSDYIQRVITQCTYTTIAKIILDFNNADSSKWIINWNKNLNVFSFSANRTYALCNYCDQFIEVDNQPIINEFLSFLLWNLWNALSYKNKNARSASEFIKTEGASKYLSMDRKEYLMNKLNCIELSLKDRIQSELKTH